MVKILISVILNCNCKFHCADSEKFMEDFVDLRVNVLVNYSRTKIERLVFGR